MHTRTEKLLPQKIKALTNALLFLSGAGALTFAAICAPNALQMLKPFLQNDSSRKYYTRKRIKEALERLAKRRLVELYQKGGELFIEITDNGKKRLRYFEFDNLQLPKKERWDKRWRVVLFDIPEKQKRARDTFQAKLKDIGFYPLQKSVFVYPFDCRDEIDFMTAFCEIKPHVHYIETANLDNKEGIVRRHFGLL